MAIGDPGDKLKDGEIPQVLKDHLKPEPEQWGPFWFPLPAKSGFHISLLGFTSLFLFVFMRKTALLGLKKKGSKGILQCLSRVLLDFQALKLLTAATEHS